MKPPYCINAYCNFFFFIKITKHPRCPSLNHSIFSHEHDQTMPNPWKSPRNNLSFAQIHSLVLQSYPLFRRCKQTPSLNHSKYSLSLGVWSCRDSYHKSIITSIYGMITPFISISNQFISQNHVKSDELRSFRLQGELWRPAATVP